MGRAPMFSSYGTGFTNKVTRYFRYVIPVTNTAKSHSLLQSYSTKLSLELDQVLCSKLYSDKLLEILMILR